jgi:hypothetical protein
MTLRGEPRSSLADNFGDFEGDGAPRTIEADAIRRIGPMQPWRGQTCPAAVQGFDEFLDNAKLFPTLVEPFEEARVPPHDA